MMKSIIEISVSSSLSELHHSNNVETHSLSKYDLRPFIVKSSKYLLNVHKSVKKLIYSLHAPVINHRLYKVNDLELLVFCWPTGETLCIPLIDHTLLVHHHQYNWLQFYPFLRQDKFNKTYLDMNYFPVLSDCGSKFKNSYLMVGRDHWGHFVVDFLSRYMMCNKSFVSKNISKILLTEMPRRETNILQTLNSFTDKEYEVISLNKNSHRIRYRDVYVADNMPPLPFLLDAKNNHIEKVENWINMVNPANISPEKIVFLDTSSNGKRIANYNELLSYAQSNGFKVIDPLQCQNKNDAKLIYGDCELIISPHGAAMLNPLIYTKKLIICLMPSLLYSKKADDCDIQQYSDITLMFGTRIIPCFGTPIRPPSTDKYPTNFTINYPHMYSTNHISEIINSIRINNLKAVENASNKSFCIKA